MGGSSDRTRRPFPANPKEIQPLRNDLRGYSLTIVEKEACGYDENGCETQSDDRAQQISDLSRVVCVGKLLPLAGYLEMSWT